MPSSFTEIITVSLEVLIILGLAGCILIFLSTAYLILMLIMRLPTAFTQLSSSPSAPEAVPSVPATAEKTKAKEAPGRSCGHCGVRNKADPIKAVVVNENTFHVFACPTCKKETLLPVKLV